MKLLIVTADEVIQTGTISYKFIFDSKLDFDKYLEYGDNYGFIWDDGNEGIGINILKNSLLKFGWGSSKGLTKEWIEKLLNKIDPVTLLMSKEKSDLFVKTCEENNIEYFLHYHKGALHSS